MTTNIKDLRAANPPKGAAACRGAYQEATLSFDIAELTYSLRTRAGLTQKELAERMGTSQPAIARMELGGHKPNLAMIERLAQALDVRIRLVAEPTEIPADLAAEVKDHLIRFRVNHVPIVRAWRSAAICSAETTRPARKSASPSAKARESSVSDSTLNGFAQSF